MPEGQDDSVQTYMQRLREDDPMRRFLEKGEREGRTSRNVVHPRYLEGETFGKRAYYGYLLEIRGRNEELNLDPQLLAFAAVHTDVLPQGEEDISTEKVRELLANKAASHYAGEVPLPPPLSAAAKKDKALRKAWKQEWDNAWNKAATAIRVQNQKEHKGNVEFWDIDGKPIPYKGSYNYTISPEDIEGLGL